MPQIVREEQFGGEKVMLFSFDQQPGSNQQQHPAEIAVEDAVTKLPGFKAVTSKIRQEKLFCVASDDGSVADSNDEGSDETSSTASDSVDNGAQSPALFKISFPSVASILGQFVNRDNQILVLGCSNVRFIVDLYAAGYKNLFCVHPSQIAVTQMQKEFGGLMPEISWLVQNPVQMDFSDHTFGAIIDKGFLDTLSNKTDEFMNSLLLELNRVMRKKAHYLCFANTDEYEASMTDMELDWSCTRWLVPANQNPNNKQVIHLYVCQRSWAWVQHIREKENLLQNVRLEYAKIIEYL
jgi:SAM-dependent methyltransferase